MGCCRTRFLVITIAFCGLASAAPFVHAHPLTSEFIRIPFGCRVSAWYPVDINNDGLWELAITCDGAPTRAGVFNPKTAAWLDGPHAIPVAGSSWSAGDFNGDGSLEYAYLKSDTIWLHRNGSGSDSALWVAPFQPSSAIFWGTTSGGRALVGLTESKHVHSEDWTYPDCPHMLDSYSWVTHVRDLMDGSELLQLSNGPSCSPVASGFPGTAANRLVIHHHQMTVDQFFFVQATDIDTILLVDPQWNRSPVLRLGAQYGGAGSPPDPAHLEHVAMNPIGSRVVVDMLTDNALRPCNLYCIDVDDGSVVWNQSFPASYYLNFAAFDLNYDDEPALFLPLNSGQGWEVRSLENGAILDTLSDVPKADLQTGSLMVFGYQDLFYIADSALYIWLGMPTSVNDDQSHTTGLPNTPWLTAHPNPFNGTVSLDWSPSPGAATLEVLNILGQRIRSYDLSAANGSPASVEWDGRDNGGNTVSSGIYFARLSGLRSPLVTKLVLLK